MKRTLLTTGLVMALLLSMTFPATAVSNEALSDSAPETAEGIAESPANEGAENDVRVSVPSAAEFVLNPYRIAVETPGGATQDAVVSEAQTISSLTPAALSVSVSAVGAERGEASLAASPEDFSPDAKSAFLWIEFQNVTDGEAPSWSGEYVGARNQVVPNGESRPVLELPASRDGEPVKAAFRVFGAAGVPSEGMWTEADGADVLLSFEFEVIEDDEATLYGVMFAAEDVAELSDDISEASDVEEPVENAQASDLEEPVEDEDASEDIVTLTDIIEPLFEDENASDVEEPVEDAQASDVEEPVEDDDASEDEEPVEDAQASDDEEPVEDAQASDVEEPVEDDAEASDDEEPVEDAQASDVEEPVEDNDASDVEEPVEDDDASDDEEPVEDDAQASDVEEPVENADASNDEEPVEDAQASDDEEPVEDEEPSDVEEPVEDDAQASDVEEPVEDENASDVEEPVEDDDAQASDDEEPVEDDDASDVEEPVEDDAQASDVEEPVEDEEPSDD